MVLSRILHDWDGPRCAQLLARVHGLLRPGGAVLVAEMLLQPDRLGPPAALLQVRRGSARRGLGVERYRWGPNRRSQADERAPWATAVHPGKLT